MVPHGACMRPPFGTIRHHERDGCSCRIDTSSSARGPSSCESQGAHKSQLAQLSHMLSCLVSRCLGHTVRWALQWVAQGAMVWRPVLPACRARGHLSTVGNARPPLKPPTPAPLMPPWIASGGRFLLSIVPFLWPMLSLRQYSSRQHLLTLAGFESCPYHHMTSASVSRKDTSPTHVACHRQRKGEASPPDPSHSCRLPARMRARQSVCLSARLSARLSAYLSVSRMPHASDHQCRPPGRH